MNLNNIQKAVLTIGVLAAVFLLVDWVADKDWLVPGPVPGHLGDHVTSGGWVKASLSKQTEMFWTWTTVVTVATGGLVLLWKSKK